MINEIRQINESENRVFDFSGYDIFKKRGNRYEILPNKVYEIIKNRFKSQEIDNIVDLGSGELTLIEKTLGFLDGKKNITCTSVDNCKDVHDRIKEKYRNKVDFVNFVFDDLMNFKEEIPKNSVDVILISHAIYHIDPKKWEELLLSLKSKLKENGIIILISRSIMGEWWNVFKSIEPEIEFYKLKSHIFSENVIEKLSKYNFTKDHITFSLHPKSLDELIKIFKFLYRIPENYILNESLLRSKIKSLSENHLYKDGYKIELYDEILIFEK